MSTTRHRMRRRLGWTLAVALLGPALARADLHHYLVVEVAGGVPNVVHHSLVEISRDRSEGTSGPSGRSQAELIAELVDGSTGAIVLRTTTAASSWVRGEFHGASAIDGAAFPLQTQTFVLRIPVVPGTTLKLRDAGGVETRFDPTEAGLRAPVSSPPAVVEPLSGWSHGDPSNRVDLLLVGEGYRNGEQGDFRADAGRVMERFLSIGPYREYANFVNAKTLFTPSAESGADHPPYVPGCQQADPWNPSCCPETGGPGSRSVDTAFDATFCAFGIQRLLIVDAGKVFSAAAAAPEWDHVIVLVNDPTYGGSGGSLAVASLHNLAPEIVQHEYGHSFTNLTDEYSAAFPGYPPCSDADPESSPCEANVTDVPGRPDLKWNHWVASGTSVPTSGSPSSPTDAGAWEGARYLESGMYRQGYDCLMRSLGRPICDVDGEAYALRLYQGGWGVPSAGISMIEPGTALPAESTFTAHKGEPIRFEAQVLGPEGGPAPLANWYRNGNLLSTTAVASGAIANRRERFLETGTFDVVLEVLDVSNTLHAVNSTVARTERTWTVNVEACPGEDDADLDGVCDRDDNCEAKANPDQADADGDGFGNVCDDCPFIHGRGRFGRCPPAR